MPDPDDIPGPDPLPAPPTVMRSLGQFVGHIVDGLKSDPYAPDDADQRILLSREVHEHARETPGGTVRVRRTIIEEVSIDPAPLKPSPAAPPGAPPPPST